MKIIYADESLMLENTAVALGNFDGVHIAHQSILLDAVNFAKSNNLTSVVYTFYEHPAKFFAKDVELLTVNSEKEVIFQKLGVDILFYQKLDSDFLKMQPENFVNDVIVKKLGAKYVVVGEHYSFGVNGSGNSSFLKNYLNDFNIKVNVLPLVYENKFLVSSSRIREMIKNGKINEVEPVLGRYFTISGKVVHGNHIGGNLGFPTANMHFDIDKIMPKFGVYVCIFEIENKKYNAIANIGIKPTIGSDRPLIEIHVFNCSKDFYQKNATVYLLDFIREEKRFVDLEALKTQVNKDIEYATEYFKKNIK